MKFQLESLLDQAELAAEQRSVRRRLCLLKARLAMQGHEGDLLIHEQAYRERLIDKLSRRETEDIPDLQADR